MINKDDLDTVLRDWNFWQQSSTPPASIPRHILDASSITLEPDLVLVIQGVRRCGKSTLLTQIMEHMRLDPQQCTFVNFEDPRLSHALDFTLLDRIVEHAETRGVSQDAHYFFFDEIQVVDGWEKWLHAKTARPSRAHYIITGSNVALLSGDLASTLTGRHLTVELFPFDFQEYRSVRPHASLDHYLREGGFPRALSFDDPERLLREYFTDIIERDVRRHVSARSTLTLIQLVKSVYESLGSELSQRSLAGMLHITADTVKTYLDACEASYLILPCPYFTFSERQRSARHKKYYPIDLGLRSAVISQTGRDDGKHLEALVFHLLRKRYRQVFYWRGKGEVDFVVHHGQHILPFQVSWEAPQERHYQAVAEFRAAFPQSEEARYITRDNILDQLL